MDQKIKVLVISSYDDNYNAVRPEGEMLIGLHRAGVEMTIMTQGHTPYAQRFREQGLEVIDYHPRSKYDPAGIQLIRQTLLEGGRQILHLFNNKAITNGLAAAWRLPVKIVTYRGYAGHIHWYDPTSYLTHLNPRIDKITCVSEAVRESFLKQLFFPGEKAVTVSKGHDPAWYENIQSGDLTEFNFPADAIVVSVVANARKMKGIPHLIDATYHLPTNLPVYFLMIGRGLDSEEVKKAIAASPYRDRFVFAGFRKDVLSLVKACDISVLPSVFGEGLSKVLLEAMFLGKPAVMTDIGGNKGLAIPDETGLVVPAGDAPALAVAIEKLATDPALRKTMGEKGRHHVATYYNIERSVAEMKKVYEELVWDGA